MQGLILISFPDSPLLLLKAELTKKLFTLDAGHDLLQIPFVRDRVNKHFFLVYEDRLCFSIPPFTINSAHSHYNEILHVCEAILGYSGTSI